MKTYTDIKIKGKKYGYRITGSRYGISLFLIELDETDLIPLKYIEYKITLPVFYKSQLTKRQIRQVCKDLLCNK